MQNMISIRQLVVTAFVGGSVLEGWKTFVAVPDHRHGRLIGSDGGHELFL